MPHLGPDDSNDDDSILSSIKEGEAIDETQQSYAPSKEDETYEERPAIKFVRDKYGANGVYYNMEPEEDEFVDTNAEDPPVAKAAPPPKAEKEEPKAEKETTMAEDEKEPKTERESTLKAEEENAPTAKGEDARKEEEEDASKAEAEDAWNAEVESAPKTEVESSPEAEDEDAQKAKEEATLKANEDDSQKADEAVDSPPKETLIKETPSVLTKAASLITKAPPTEESDAAPTLIKSP